MAKKLKYKDLIKKFTPFSEDDVVMVASCGATAFYDKDGVHRIIGVVECESDGLLRVKEE